MKRGEEVEAIRARWSALEPTFNEALRRRWVAAEARALGRGGLSLVSAATGVSLPTIRKGIRELAAGLSLPTHRIRRPGGGRKPLPVRDATLLDDLKTVLETKPQPQPLRVIALTAPELRQALRQRGHAISTPSVGKLLRQRGYRWHTGRSLERRQELSRWHYLTARIQQFLRCGQLVLSIELSRHRGRHAAFQSELSAIEAAASPQALLGITRRAARSSAALVGAALHWFVHLQDPRLLSSGGEVLLVVGLDARRSASAGWRIECQRLADELRMRVQILLVPSGIYRWQALEQVMSCDVAHTLPRGTHQRASLEIGRVVQPSPIDRSELAPRLYAAAYPNGLISDEPTDRDDTAWSFRSRGLRGTKRTPRASRK